MLLPVPDGITTALFQGVVAGASAAYSLKRGIPTVEEIAQHCNHSKKNISRVIQTDEFKQLMKFRGFPFETTKLTPEQYFAVSIITDPSNKKPMGVKLKQAGINYATYRAWLKQPHFKEYITQISEAMLDEHVADVHTMVVNQATNGNLTAAKMFYELNGRYDPNKQQMVDLQNIIGLLLEIITRYVPDAVTLRKINEDINTVLSGGTPRALEQFDVARIAANSEPVDIVDAVVEEENAVVEQIKSVLYGTPIGSDFLENPK